MKTTNPILLAFTGLMIFTCLHSRTLSAQETQNAVADQKKLSPEILAITTKSCNNCHAEPARGLSISLLNLSKWETLSAKKQASMSRKIYKEVSGNKMPPKSFLEKNKEAMLSKDDISTINNWVQSLNKK